MSTSKTRLTKKTQVKVDKAKVCGLKAEEKVKKHDEPTEEDAVTYRKEYYKATHKFGIKRFQSGIGRQIFTVGITSWSKDDLAELCDKLLHDLNKIAKGNLEEEQGLYMLCMFKLA